MNSLYRRTHILSLLQICMIGLAILLLSGCNTQIDTTLSVYEQGEYEMINEVSIPRAAMQMVGPQEIERQLDKLVADFSNEPQVTRASWAKKTSDDNYLRYAITVNGSCGEANCTESSFQIIPYPQGGKDAYLFSMSMQEFAQTGGISALTLRADTILQSNADSGGNDTATWRQFTEDPRAVFIPLSRFGRWPIGNVFVLAALGFAVILGSTGAVLVIRSRRSNPRAGIEEDEAQVIKCPSCSAVIPHQAVYCPKCGVSLRPNQVD